MIPGSQGGERGAPALGELPTARSGEAALAVRRDRLLQPYHPNSGKQGRRSWSLPDEPGDSKFNC